MSQKELKEHYEESCKEINVNCTSCKQSKKRHLFKKHQAKACIANMVEMRERKERKLGELKDELAEVERQNRNNENAGNNRNSGLNPY